MRGGLTLGYCASSSHSYDDTLSHRLLPVDVGMIPDSLEVVVLMEHLKSCPVTATDSGGLLLVISVLCCRMYRVGGWILVEVMS